MESNKKKGLLALLGFGTLAYIIWKKPAVTIQQSFTEGGGGGGGGIMMMSPSSSAPPPTSTTTDTGKTTTTTTTTTPIDPCDGMGKYNTTTKMCDNDTRCGGGSYDPVGKKCAQTTTGGGGTYGGGSYGDTSGVCAGTGFLKNGMCEKDTRCGGGTYDPVKSSCLSAGTGGATSGGNVVIGFAGKYPLTLDNLLH